MLADRPGETLLPETVQGIIAARLDTLPAEEKELLQDAAVVGKVFWLGALRRERSQLEERVHSLERKEFLSRQRRTSVAGEDEYSFRHALVRDVVYEQIPKSKRPEKHLAAAEWFESLGRAEDHAEMLAHHYGSALEYTRATGANGDAFAERAREAFQEAGDRAFALNAFRQASLFYERALEFWAKNAPPELLLRYGRTLAVSDDERGTAVLERALDGLLAAGDDEAAAEAHAFLTEALHMQGRRDASYDHSERALELVRDAPPSAAKARVLTESSRLLALDEQPLAFTVAQEAYEMALELGLVELAARAMCNLGLAKTQVMDFDGAAADLERSVELARSVGSPEEARACHNLGSATFFRGNLKRASDLFAEAAGLGRRFGALQLALASSSVHCTSLCSTGAWDESLRIADDLIAQLERGGASYFEYHLRYARSRIGLARAAAAELVLADARRAVQVGRSAKDRQALIPMLSNLAFVAAELGELDEADAAGRELSPLLADASPINVHRTIEIAYVADSLHCADALRHLARSAPKGYIWRDAVLAVLDLDFGRAAALHASLGHVDEGYARLRAGQRYLSEGRRSEAESELQASIAFHRPLGATRYIRQAEALLTEAGLEIPA
jgi:tetratricopeptide (TPR) repeat protein